MARERTIQLIDDLVGGEAKETHEFGYNGKIYEIDLNDTNGQALEDGLLPFVRAARVIGKWKVQPQAQTGVRIPVSSSAPIQKLTREGRRVAREWAKKQGWEVSERGRLPEDVVDAFLKYHYPDGTLR